MTYEEAYNKERGGVHYLADPDTRKKAHGYEGGGLVYPAPLCNIGDGHAETTNQREHVTCECCRSLIFYADNLRDITQ